MPGPAQRLTVAGPLEPCLHDGLKISLGNSSLPERRELRDICLFQDCEKGSEERVVWAKHDRSDHASPWSAPWSGDYE